ncbi:serine hydrolase [Streptomyces sp. NPDC052051]|uniref:D-alanyl-D-alanine carboxypeptidase family protein n=1 Tax=Streptomyces sp. NPDC052051 TaxID=3154649 RepID=UPI00341FF959
MGGRTIRRSRVLRGAVSLLAIVGAGGCAAGRDGEGGSAPTEAAQVAPVDRLRLPWPAEGQASITVEGLGSLGSKGGRRPVPIASLTKVMTALVILKEHPLAVGEPGLRITVDEQAAQESRSLSESTAPLQAGQRLTQRQFLELMLLPSGNNVARLLARWDAGSEEAFVDKMNRAALGLGMAHTRYTGASGIEPTTTSTADDQLKLARQAMHVPVLRAVVAMRSTTVPGVPGPIINTNRLLGRSGVIGLKTGSSTPAGGALMWAAWARSGGKPHLVLGVVLAQRASTTPVEGLEAAFERSEALIEAVQERLPAALDTKGRV